MAIEDYKATPALNVTLAGTPLQEGQTRNKDLNDQVRQILADIKSGTAMRVASVATLQGITFATDTVPGTVIIEREGLFYYDSADTTTADDGSTVIVTTSGERFKVFGSLSPIVPNSAAVSKLTIASGAVIPAGFAHTIETESTVSSDDLDTITATNYVSGNLLMISAFNAARTVVVKHDTGNILLPDNADISLDDDEKTLLLRYNGAKWVYVAGAGGAGGGSVSDTIPNAATATELTISSGAVTPTRGTHTIDTESDAASDDLATITATNFSAGNILTISAANGARTVVVKHGTGNILLPNNLDIALDDAEKTVILRYDGANWNYIAGAGSGASPVVPNTATGSELTIASGAVVPTQFSHTIDSESDASADDLDTITATNFKTGDIIAISAESASHVITVKHGTGNILLPDDTDITLDDIEKTLLLRYDGTNWNFVAGASVATAEVGVKIPNSTTATELTISSGAVTPVRATHTIDTESDASTDNLDTLTASNFSAGQILYISAENAVRTVVVKHGTGNILLPNDTDISLDDDEKTLCLRYDGSNWIYQSGGGGVDASTVSAIVPNATSDSELTIASGAIVPTRAAHTVDTEGDAASDDLDTITATNFTSGNIIAISAEDGGRTVVLKHGTGNIVHPNGFDVVLDDAVKTVKLRYDGTNWNVIGLVGVDGPASATDSNIAAFDGTTGRLLKDSGFKANGGFIPGGTIAADGNNEITVAPRRRYQLTASDSIAGVIGLSDGEFCQLIAPSSGSATLEDAGSVTSGLAFELSGADKTISTTDEAIYTIQRVGSAIRVSGGGGGSDFSDTSRHVTAANLASAAHAINTSAKRLGAVALDTTNNRMFFALGSGATDKWRPFDDQSGTSDVTPA